MKLGRLNHVGIAVPEMDAALSAANIRNYSIYLREPEMLLFGYWEYTGSDYAADMRALGERAREERRERHLSAPETPP